MIGNGFTAWPSASGRFASAIDDRWSKLPILDQNVADIPYLMRSTAGWNFT